MLSTNNVTISLGNPVTVPFLVPVEHKSAPACISDPFMVGARCFRVTAMSFGNPHGAVFVDDLENVDVSELGLALGTHALFPKGADIVFIQVLDKENIKACLWQKDKGEAVFTAEAACVAGTAAMMCHKVLLNDVSVFMGGNKFHMKWDRGVGVVSLTGPEDLLSA